MKKWIALLLTLAAVVCTACSQTPEETTGTTTEATQATQPTTEAPTTQPTTEATEPPTMANEFFDPVASKDLVDTWSVEVLLDGSLLNFTDLEKSVTMKLQYQLNNDGTYVRGVAQEEYDQAIAAYESYIRDYMLGRRYAKFAAEKKLEGKDEEEIKEAWAQTGWPEAQVEVNTFVDGLYLGYRFSALNRVGDYYAQDGVLYLSQEDGSYEACTYQLAEGSLQLLDSTDLNTYTQVKLTFPLTLTNGTIPPVPQETTPTEAE